MDRPALPFEDAVKSPSAREPGCPLLVVMGGDGGWHGPPCLARLPICDASGGRDSFYVSQFVFNPVGYWRTVQSKTDPNIC